MDKQTPGGLWGADTFQAPRREQAVEAKGSMICGAAFLGPVVLALLIGVGVNWAPLAAVVIPSVTILLGIRSVNKSTLPRLYLVALAILLMGYTFFGRGFAYLGIPPMFVGEMVLGLGLIAALAGGGDWAVLRSPAMLVLLIYSGWGFVRTVPYFASYGIDAARDAVIWAYGGFALLTASLLLESRWLYKAIEWYRRWAPWWVVWIVPITLLSRFGFFDGMHVPFSDVPIVSPKAGDISVHLAGIAAFALLDMRRRISNNRSQFRVLDSLFWVLWSAGVLVSANRAGMLSIVGAIFVVFILSPLHLLGRRFRFVFTLLVLVLASLVFNLRFELEAEKSISVTQAWDNLRSVWQSNQFPALAATREWRLSWWQDIVHYTLLGEFFWTGKGFGINLADDDGYQVTSDGSLRSPHNGHLTILARAGVPGLVLWLALQLAYTTSILRMYTRSTGRNDEFWRKLSVWMLAYWTAMMINATFDVFLEGPHGGIWYWSLLGFGIASLIQYNRGDVRGPLDRLFSDEPNPQKYSFE